MVALAGSCLSFPEAGIGKLRAQADQLGILTTQQRLEAANKTIDINLFVSCQSCQKSELKERNVIELPTHVLWQKQTPQSID